MALKPVPADARPVALQRVVCPHCWERSELDEILWVAEHAELRGDGKLGADVPRRFLPSRFTPEGDALDARGRPCHQLACPKCHLTLPRVGLEMEPLFLSLLGTPGSGKSYFLTSAMWTLRAILPHEFGLGFADADPLANQTLVRAEEELFLNPEPDALAWLGGLIRKTDAAVANTELYDNITQGSQAVSYLRPYLFTLRPIGDHPSAGRVSGRMLCLYDNAGEHFLPGQDTAANPVTRHLALSRAILFLFDPTQDPRFRDACHRAGLRPPRFERDRAFRQETTLGEAAERARSHARLAGGGGNAARRLLIVVVSKYDTWAPLLALPDEGEPWWKSPSGGVAGLDVEQIERRSAALERLLLRLSPEIVGAARSFSAEVVYIPVSALGPATEHDPTTGNLGIRPRNIAPVGVAIPFLYALYRTAAGLVPRLRRKG